MGWLYPVLALVALQRLVELWVARRNTERLRAAGAVEHGAAHYPLFVLLHAAWLVALALFVSADQAPNISLLIVFALLQVGRIWVIAALGRFWSTRILTIANAPLVRRGPYRLTRHPNYLIVIAEIAVLPLAFDAWAVAGVFSVLNLVLVGWRIRIEDACLDERRTLSIDPEAT
ncbi:MAG: isoprenylcysteine carboxylmethyltransferase family protein [Proteobacteria bacterium]|nr:isoprenylcysteine carboxylmethyltransferase family protein [Pseudomonadota bacterium]MDA1059582.1 isoprenylcysteine carboxylmethyltransferase family protein [Pseudomonadota bacterium]